MSHDSRNLDNPPAYVEKATNEIWEPSIFILAGTTIHVDSADTAPLYQLSRAVTHVTSATKEVQFERFDRSVKTPATTEEPSVVPRTRHIYTVVCTARYDGRIAPHVFIKSVSRRTLGHLGTKRSHRLFRSKGLEVHPVDLAAWKANCGGQGFVPGANALFSIDERSGRTVWSNSSGKAIAIEESSAKAHRFITTSALDRETVDAVLALWCGRIWQQSIAHAEPVHQGVKEHGMYFE